jgi:hypothetical protein
VHHLLVALLLERERHGHTPEQFQPMFDPNDEPLSICGPPMRTMGKRAHGRPITLPEDQRESRTYGALREARRQARKAMQARMGQQPQELATPGGDR